MPKSLTWFCQLIYLNCRTIDIPLEYFKLTAEIFSRCVIPSPSSLCPQPYFF